MVNQRILADKHLKLTLKKDQMILEAIYFNQAEMLPNTIEAAYQLQTNRYNGIDKVQLNIRYVKT